MTETLLLYAPTRKLYEAWIRAFGLAFKNVQFEYIQGEGDVKDCEHFPAGSTFFTVVDGTDDTWRDTNVMTALSGYRYAARESIEKAVKTSGRVVTPQPF